MDYFKVTTVALLLIFLLHFSVAGNANCSTVKNCKSCLKYNETTCFWCSSTDTCIKKDTVIPKGCKSIDWRYYGNCTVPGYVWVIVIPILAFLFLVSLGCCFYCCCCRGKRSTTSMDKEETRFHRKRMELKAKHDERRAERKLKTDEIRNKYGLHNEDGGSTSNRYAQFDNDPDV